MTWRYSWGDVYFNISSLVEIFHTFTHKHSLELEDISFKRLLFKEGGNRWTRLSSKKKKKGL